MVGDGSPGGDVVQRRRVGDRRVRRPRGHVAGRLGPRRGDVQGDRLHTAPRYATAPGDRQWQCGARADRLPAAGGSRCACVEQTGRGDRHEQPVGRGRRRGPGHVAGDVDDDVGALERVHADLPVRHAGDHLVGDGVTGTRNVDVRGERHRGVGGPHGEEAVGACLGGRDVEHRGRCVDRHPDGRHVDRDRRVRRERCREPRVDRPPRGEAHEPAGRGGSGGLVDALHVDDVVGTDRREDRDEPVDADRHGDHVGHGLPGQVGVGRRHRRHRRTRSARPTRTRHRRRRPS